jgi:hypothetical protein
MNWWLNVKSELSKLGAVLTLGIIVGLVMGWMLWIPKPTTKRESAAPAVVQKDGSVVLKRGATQEAKPVHQTPKGSVVERVIHVEALRQPAVDPGQPEIDSSLFKLDLTLVRLDDGTRRVVASSPDGTVVASTSVDTPVEPSTTPKPMKHAAGAVYGRTQYTKAIGIFIDRDMAFLRLGVEITKNTHMLANTAEWEGRVKLGLRF